MFDSCKFIPFLFYFQKKKLFLNSFLWKMVKIDLTFQFDLLLFVD